MKVNFERVTKNITQFVLTLFEKNKEATEEVASNMLKLEESFEYLNKNLKSNNYKIKYDLNSDNINNINIIYTNNTTKEVILKSIITKVNDETIIDTIIIETSTDILTKEIVRIYSDTLRIQLINIDTTYSSLKKE